MRTIERHLQQCLNRIEDWPTRNGFNFFKSKMQCVHLVHFCQQRKIHNDPALYIYGSQIPVVAESKFLGVIFDGKLFFIPHIKYVKAKGLKALNILKVLSRPSWSTLFLIFHPGALLNQLFFSIYTIAKSHFLIHIS